MSQDSPDTPDNPDNPAVDPPPGDRPAAPQPPAAEPPAADVADYADAAVDTDAAGPAGTADPAPGGKGKLLLVAGLVVVALGAAVLLTRGGGSDSGSPVGTVETMYTALREKDCDALLEVMTEATWSEDGASTREEAIDECEISAEQESDALPEDVELDYELASEDDETAVVDVVARFEGQSFETPIVLVQEDGRWKVDGDRTDAASGEADADAGGD